MKSLHDLLHLTEIIMNEEGETLVPLKKIYLLISQEKADNLPPYNEYIEAVRADERFKVITVPLDDMSEMEWNDEYKQALEEHNCYQGPYVMFEGESIDQEEFVVLLLDKIGHIQSVLYNMYRYKSENNAFGDGEEDKMQELILKAESIHEQLELMKKDLE